VGVPTNIAKPLFILQGTTDNIVHSFNNAVPFYNVSGAPRYLAMMENGSHTGFLTQAPGIESAFPTTPLDDVICSSLLEVLGNDPIAQACQLCNPFPLPLRIRNGVTKYRGSRTGWKAWPQRVTAS
jgi:hypothetical protein